jgi:hypothetical protein
VLRYNVVNGPSAASVATPTAARSASADAK